MDEDIFVSKFDVKGEPIYIKIKWKPNECDLFHIKLLNDNASWSGVYSMETANNFRELVDEDSMLYEDNVKKCLQSYSSKYILDFVTNDNNSGELCWKKKFEGSTAVLKHGKVVLCRDKQKETKEHFIDALLNKNKELRQIIEKCKQDNEVLMLDLEKCKKELANFADLKISMESTLYSKFIKLLNVKKKRIQLLEDLLKDTEKN